MSDYASLLFMDVITYPYPNHDAGLESLLVKEGAGKISVVKLFYSRICAYLL